MRELAKLRPDSEETSFCRPDMSVWCPLADIWTCNARETKCQLRSNTLGKSP
jgi:hypothetical protein